LVPEFTLFGAGKTMSVLSRFMEQAKQRSLTVVLPEGKTIASLRPHAA